MDKQAALMEKVSTLSMTALFALAMVVLGGIQLFGHGGFSGPLAVLAPWLHPLVFGGGVVLLLLVGIQLFGGSSGVAHHHHHGHAEGECCGHDHHPAPGQPHQHDHAGDCHHHDHDHHHHDQDRAPPHDPKQDRSLPLAELGHQHAHDHSKDHGHAHDHGWSPIKYIPLVIPLLLCAMGMPTGEMIRAFQRDLFADSTQGATMMVSAAPGDPLRQLSSVATLAGPLADGAGLALALGMVTDILDEDPEARPEITDLAELERIAAQPTFRDNWSRKRSVEVQGMFNPGQQLENGMHFFTLVQIRVACCMGDARPAVMLAASRKEPVAKPMEWVAVRGRLDFVRTDQGFKPAMRVFKIEKRDMPARPFLTK